MKRLPVLLLIMAVFPGCDKDDEKEEQPGCDMEQTYTDNEQKVTTATGIYGTIAFMEGNCMPMVGPGSTCKTCPVKRTIRIYEYTLKSQATPQNATIFYDSFSTLLIKELETDEEGFFQTELPPGKYTIVTIENGKLHASGSDGQGGLNPFTHTGVKQRLNLTLHYNAAF